MQAQPSTPGEGSNAVPPPKSAEDDSSALSPREREVLQLVVEGHTTKSIAEELHITYKTAETHRLNLMSKLDIHDVAGLVRWAIEHGLICE